MFRWTEQSIRFRIDAAEQVGFDERIAERILPYLTKRGSVCDAGCGLGYLSLALAKYCETVTAVDSCAEALAVLERNARENGIGNIEIRQGDLFSMRPERPYDAMVFCFFGRVSETLRAAKAQCRGKVILIKRNGAKHRFTLGETPLERFTFPRAEQALDELGVPYEKETFEVEMGQPFRSLEDAVSFFETFRREDDARGVTRTDVKSLLETRASDAFPYYLPSPSPVGVIAVDTGNIPDSIK